MAQLGDGNPIMGIWTDTADYIQYNNFISFNPPLKVGTYQITDTSSMFYNTLYAFEILALKSSGAYAFIYFAKKVTVNITRVDATGGLIQGNFSGTFENTVLNPTDLPIITGSFSVLRKY